MVRNRQTNSYDSIPLAGLTIHIEPTVEEAQAALGFMEAIRMVLAKSGGFSEAITQLQRSNRLDQSWRSSRDHPAG